MELATNTETETDVEAATQAMNEAEAKRTDQGPDIQLDEPKAEKAEKDAKPGEAKVEQKDKKQVDPEKVIEALRASKKDDEPDHPGVHKGLQHVQADLAGVKRELAASNAERSEIKELLRSLASKKGPADDKLAVLSELSGEEIIDGPALTKSLKAVVEHLDGKIDELKKTQKSTTDEIKQQAKPQPRELSTQEVVVQIEQMFPDLDKKFAPFIHQQAAPHMEQYLRDNPKATQSEKSLAATNFLTQQAYEVRMALLSESSTPSDASTQKSKTKKPTGSTKVVDDSASSATMVNTSRGAMESLQDFKDKWLNTPD